MGRCPSPDNPWAEYATEILYYKVPFEKFSQCFRPEDYYMNNIAICKNSEILLLSYGEDIPLFFHSISVVEPGSSNFRV